MLPFSLGFVLILSFENDPFSNEVPIPLCRHRFSPFFFIAVGRISHVFRFASISSFPFSCLVNSDGFSTLFSRRFLAGEEKPSLSSLIFLVWGSPRKARR